MAEGSLGSDLWVHTPLSTRVKGVSWANTNLIPANLSHPDLRVLLEPLSLPHCLLRLRLKGETFLHTSYSY